MLSTVDRSKGEGLIAGWASWFPGEALIETKGGWLLGSHLFPVRMNVVKLEFTEKLCISVKLVSPGFSFLSFMCTS